MNFANYPELTDTELNDMAAAANMGFNRGPPNR